MTTYCIIFCVVIISFISGSLQEKANVTMSGAQSNTTTSADYTKWTPWSKCENCWQNRLKICTSPVCKNSRVYEERPCDRKRCLRQRHMKSIDKRLHIFKKLSKKHIKRKRGKQQIWSKWSEWQPCSKDCQTYRYKSCKKPGRCKRKKKVEKAYCYIESSNCEIYIVHLLNRLDIYSNKNYQEVANTYRYNTARNSNKKTPKKYKECGRPFRKEEMLRIIGGRNAPKNKWPWHVAILNKEGEVFCSGTLIANRWVLTAAHCYRPILKVTLNEYDLSSIDGSELTLNVVKVIQHPDFSRITVDNDIALLQLPRSVDLPVACLPQHLPTVGEYCSIMGWGKIRNADILGYPILQEAKIPVVNATVCHKAYRSYYLSRNMFCAGTSDGKVDTCAGDSGGGLMCQSKSGPIPKHRYIIQGITSFGDGCAQKDKYGIYTNIYNYIDWIHKTINQHRIRIVS